MNPDSSNSFDPSWIERYVAPTYGRFPVWMERGEGPYVWDSEGKKYLDFAGGVAVCPLGHSHPEVAEAIGRQAATLTHVSNWYCIRQQAELAKVLVEDVMGLPGKCFFGNSGAEANEGMIKLARRYGAVRPQTSGEPRFEILTFSGSFHGRTFAAMSATAQPKIHEGFGPLLPGFVYLPFNDVAALKAAVTERTVAVMMEPVQGESGVQPATAEFLRAAAAIRREHDLLLLLDEVQCGLGRTGDLAGWRSIVPGDEIQPDAVSWAKSIANGFPIGSFWINDRPTPDGTPLSSVLGAGMHGSTYGGSPLASTAALATLGVILRDDLPNHAAEMGRKVAGEVASWKHPLMRDIRAFGMMIGFELDAEALAAAVADSMPGKLTSVFVAAELLKAGLLVVPAGPAVVRWLPPMNVSKAHIEEGLSILKSTLDALASKTPSLVA
jgi:acetylornithine/succinyldiaminopimelate/putrescine aminotransferase